MAVFHDLDLMQLRSVAVGDYGASEVCTTGLACFELTSQAQVSFLSFLVLLFLLFWLFDLEHCHQPLANLIEDALLQREHGKG